jgi:uncharacterized delta-60 repeat protein
MKKLILPILFLLCISTANSQWITNFNGAVGDVNFASAKGNAITTDAYGNSYVTGYSYEGTNGNDVVTMKYSSIGEIIWAENFNGSASVDDEGTGICVDALGNIYVVGTTKSTLKSFDLTLLKYDSSGTLLWDKEYSSAEGYKEDRGLGIVVDSDGNIYVTGFTTYGDHTEIVTQKYDTAGAIIWTAFQDGTTTHNGLEGQGSCIEVSASGNVFVGGYIKTAESGTDIIAIKYNSDGELQWTRPINGGGNQEDKAWGIIVDSYENSYISGYVTDSVNHEDCYTAKISSTGSIIWSTTYNGGGNSTDKAWGIVVDTDGSVFVTGETTDADSNVNYITISYSSNGVQNWTATYNGTGNGDDRATAIGIIMNADSTKSIVVTGKSWGVDNNYDYATVRYAGSVGSQTHLSRYSMNGITSDIAKDLVVAPDNKVLITGFSQLIIDAPVAPSYVSTMMLNWSQSSELTTIRNNSPNKFSLRQNYPNPFNPSTTIAFEIPKGSIVKLVIYDMLGRQTDVLINQYLNAGTHNITYSNLNLSSGIYFYELTAGNYRDIKKMTLIK